MARTKEFDVNDALRKAMETFWERGFECTSMCDLLAGMGITRGSFYDTFKSKHDVLIAALNLYADERFEEFEACAAGRSAREVIHSFFEGLCQDNLCTRMGWGCMLVNAGIERAGHDADVQAVVLRTLKRHERFFRDRIEQDQQQGRLPATIDATDVASALMAMVLGVQVLARAGFPRRAFAAVARQADQLLDGQCPDRG